MMYEKKQIFINLNAQHQLKNDKKNRNINMHARTSSYQSSRMLKTWWNTFFK